jgi:hypothetical protein
MLSVFRGCLSFARIPRAKARKPRGHAIGNTKPAAPSSAARKNNPLFIYKPFYVATRRQHIAQGNKHLLNSGLHRSRANFFDQVITATIPAQKVKTPAIEGIEKDLQQIPLQGVVSY